MSHSRVVSSSDRLSKIKIDGAALATDQTSVEAVEATTITVPDYGGITVQPAIKDREKLIEQQRAANKARSEANPDAPDEELVKTALRSMAKV